MKRGQVWNQGDRLGGYCNAKTKTDGGPDLTVVESEQKKRREENGFRCIANEGPIALRKMKERDPGKSLDFWLKQLSGLCCLFLRQGWLTEELV